jgi:phosphoribosylglycinamide formyltransferase-1
MPKITFLCSGNGGNLKFLYLLSKFQSISTIELSVIADRACGATVFASDNHIEFRIVNVKGSQQQELSDSISEFNPALVFTTIHRVIAPQVLELHGKSMLNLHYSKLPLYAGVIGMQGVERAIRNQDPQLGVTTHELTSELDGGPITIQSYFDNPNNYSLASKTSFRIGCLHLWDSLQQLERNRSQLANRTEDLIQGITVHHSRPISNLPNFVDESFWLNLSTM